MKIPNLSNAAGLKGWRYKLLDSSYPIRPIWAVAFVFATAAVFLYVIWPGLVLVVLAAILLVEIIILIRKWKVQTEYRAYIKKSHKGEEGVLETTLSEPPLRR